MRSQEEMLKLILDIAREDPRIRAVILNGSRADPNASSDIFQDFDIVYLVTDLAPFIRNTGWIRRFGELMIFQAPDDMGDPPPENHDAFAYLMQFADGNRIDLTIFPIENLDRLEKDSQSLLLLDKDGIIGALEPPSDRDYLPKPPTAKQFDDCTNEFWWVCPYIAKGLWRGEIIYAKHTFEIVREELMKMLTWYAGLKTGFSISPGKFGKNLPQLLEPELAAMLLRTYSDAGCENTWEALFTMCNLFRSTAQQVAEHFGFNYPEDDDRRVSAHLRHVRTLPRDSEEIY